MPILLFRLNGVPDDEADEVRALLTEHGIDFYETEAGRWGFSVAGVWLPDEADAERAHALLETYQAERTARVRRAYAAEQRAGRQETMLRRFLQRPLTFILYAIAIGVVLYLSLVPLLNWR